MSTEHEPEVVADDQPHTDRLDGLRIAFVGKLGSMNRRQASQLVRQHGGTPVDRCEMPLDVVVLGADELPLGDDSQLEETVREAAARGQVTILSETQFWERLGLLDDEPYGRRLYTPAMLADLLGVSVGVIRRWHRRGLIVPTREVHRLPYFDFQEVATARRLAELLAAGAKPEDVERQLEQFARLVPDVDRPLAQLSIIVEGRGLLLRQGEGLIEPGGQMRLDFDDLSGVTRPGVEHPEGELEMDAEPQVLPIASWLTQPHEMMPDADDLVAAACDLEDAGRVDEAVDAYRLVLAVGGPRADVCFRLAELLYLTGDVTAARERYAMAIELDEDYVEARANLGCVLAETGRRELAIAAFEGALHSHPDYPDAHYHLARTLDDVGQFGAAEQHWRAFLELAPESPWAEEARIRLQQREV